MTPSNPSPDAGAGTPLRWYSPCGYSVVGLFAAAVPIPTCPECYSTAWATLPPPFAVRPATDPAGLDAIVDRCRQHIAGLGADLSTIKAREATSAQRDAAADRAYAHLKGIDTILTDALAARLSVADGPGPEERSERSCVMCSDEHQAGPCFGGDRCFAEERPDWRGHLNAIRRLLVGSPPNADMIDAVIGYALNDCEAAIDAALGGPGPGPEERPDLEAAARQALDWFDIPAGEYHDKYGTNDEPRAALRAALPVEETGRS